MMPLRRQCRGHRAVARRPRRRRRPPTLPLDPEEFPRWWWWWWENRRWWRLRRRCRARHPVSGRCPHQGGTRAGAGEGVASPTSSHCGARSGSSRRWAPQRHRASSPRSAMSRRCPHPMGVDRGVRGRTASRRTMSNNQWTGGSWSAEPSHRARGAAPSRTKPVASPWARPAATTAGASLSAAPVARPSAAPRAGRASPRRPRASAAKRPRARRSSPTCGLRASAC